MTYDRKRKGEEREEEEERSAHNWFNFESIQSTNNNTHFETGTNRQEIKVLRSDSYGELNGEVTYSLPCIVFAEKMGMENENNKKKLDGTRAARELQKVPPCKVWQNYHLRTSLTLLRASKQ